MACDGMITDGDTICVTNCRKIRRLSDGRIVGFAGNAYNYKPFADWLEGGEGDPPKVEEGLACLVLAPDGGVTSYDEHGRSFPENGKWAIGSGQHFAIAAMDLGKSAEEAVAYAMTRDVYSGGEITVLTLEPPLRAVA
jgi:ATP-dependent protease HslVU (ClpYQ) peptidase subunit